MIAKVDASIAAQNTFSDGIVLHGDFNISLSGTWVATVVVQRKLDGQSDYQDILTFTENTEQVGFEPEYGATYRIGIKTGAYTSGTAVCRISQ